FIAAITDGAGPNPLSLAPRRARNGRPLCRSCVSGPTKGTVEGSDAASAVSVGIVGMGFPVGIGIDGRFPARRSERLCELRQHRDLELRLGIVAGHGSRRGLCDHHATCPVAPYPLAVDADGRETVPGIARL